MIESTIFEPGGQFLFSGGREIRLLGELLIPGVITSPDMPMTAGH